MMARAYRIALKSPDGSPAFTGIVTIDEITQIPSRETPSPNGLPAPIASVPGAKNDRDTSMTEPQRRYLFRLFAAQGVEPKDAETQIKTYFGVTTLTAILKTEASQLIDELLRDPHAATTPRSDHGREGGR
jgi:hypothetical protein